MGAYSPAPVMTPEMIERTMREIIEPTMRGMAELDAPFSGVLFAGLMITAEGPKLIEYNVRFGDPECQVLMMRLKDDLLVLLGGAADGQLGHLSARWRDDAALTVVMAAQGYPAQPEKGSQIRGVDAAGSVEGVEVFHAGTVEKDGKLLANGGRVLNVTAMAGSVSEAQGRAYAAVDRSGLAARFLPPGHRLAGGGAGEGGQMTVTIYHNPACGTSRNTLAMIKASGETPEVIEYLVEPPSRARLVELLGLLQLSAHDLLRRKDTPYAALGLDDPKWSDEQLIDFMVAHPILINRPIVVSQRGAMLARPSEKVLEILATPVQRFEKEDGEVVTFEP